MVPELSAGEFEVYFRLVWLFVIIMFFIIIILYYLYLAMRRARDRESESLAFSRLVIAGQEAERRRVSCELHDTVLPELRRFAGDADTEALISRQRLLAERIREICMELMPPDFSRLSLADSLVGLCASFSGRTGIECLPALEEDLGLDDLDSDKQLHLYRMVQEALTNIEKHSGARRAALVVRRIKGEASAGSARGKPRRRAGGLLICVSDDGAGLPRDTPPPTGLGMRSMRERAAVLGARLDFISESDNGLMVRIEVPGT